LGDRFRVVGRINADDKDVDVDSLGDHECLEIMDGRERIGYVCRVGDRIVPYGDEDIVVEGEYAEE